MNEPDSSWHCDRSDGKEEGEKLVPSKDMSSLHVCLIHYAFVWATSPILGTVAMLRGNTRMHSSLTTRFPIHWFIASFLPIRKCRQWQTGFYHPVIFYRIDHESPENLGIIQKDGQVRFSQSHDPGLGELSKVQYRNCDRVWSRNIAWASSVRKEGGIGKWGKDGEDGRECESSGFGGESERER